MLRVQACSSCLLWLLDHIRCELIAKQVSGETPGRIFTELERFCSGRQKRTSRRDKRQERESTSWKEYKRVNVEGRMSTLASKEYNRVNVEERTSRLASTKPLPQCVFHSFHK
jgi:hypothetical protein